jgi:Icc-related predicted phosphoesterase
MKILSISDIELGFIYSPQIKQRFRDIDLVISCGDLPYFYLEYIISTLDRPLYYVRGNHAARMEIGAVQDRHFPWGGTNLHERHVRDDSGLLLSGIEGSLRYNTGPYQYTQNQMWMMVFSLIPGLLINRLRFGRYLDIFVTHAPPWKLHDADDLPHQGIKAFRWFINVFQPTYFLHGHIHVYCQDTVTHSWVNKTQVMNTYGFREFEIKL